MSEPESNRPPETSLEVARGKNVVFYDGVCALCNGVVRFLLARDDRRLFRFAPLQSHFAEQVLRPAGLDPSTLQTMYLVTAFRLPEQRIFKKSRAVLEMLRILGGAWKVTAVFGVLPTFFLDACYSLVARIRYATFGRYDSCPLPEPEHRDRFIEG